MEPFLKFKLIYLFIWTTEGLLGKKWLPVISVAKSLEEIKSYNANNWKIGEIMFNMYFSRQNIKCVTV